MALSEKRIQIYLPMSLVRSLKKEVREEKKSIAHIIREAIESHLEERRLRKLD